MGRTPLCWLGALTPASSCWCVSSGGSEWRDAKKYIQPTSFLVFFWSNCFSCPVCWNVMKRKLCFICAGHSWQLEPDGIWALCVGLFCLTVKKSSPQRVSFRTNSRTGRVSACSSLNSDWPVTPAAFRVTPWNAQSFPAPHFLSEQRLAAAAQKCTCGRDVQCSFSPFHFRTSWSSTQSHLEVYLASAFWFLVLQWQAEWNPPVSLLQGQESLLVWDYYSRVQPPHLDLTQVQIPQARNLPDRTGDARVTWVRGPGAYARLGDDASVCKPEASTEAPSAAGTRPESSPFPATGCQDHHPFLQWSMRCFVTPCFPQSAFIVLSSKSEGTSEEKNEIFHKSFSLWVLLFSLFRSSHSLEISWIWPAAEILSSYTCSPRLLWPIHTLLQKRPT